MITVKLYTNTNIYKGWLKYSNNNFLTFVSWIQSDNYLIIDNKIINNIKNI